MSNRIIKCKITTPTIKIKLVDDTPIKVKIKNFGVGDMKRSIYDINNNNIVDKAESIDDGNGNTATAIDIKDSVTKKHSHSNKSELDKITDGDHDIRTDNPHNVTKTQIGLLYDDYYKLYVISED